MTYPKSSFIIKPLLILFFGLVTSVENANAQLGVILDYTDFEIRLGEVTSAAAVPDFNTVETNQIKGNIAFSLSNVYSGYAINFSETSPATGSRIESLMFGATTTFPGRLGLADGIDLLNRSDADVGRVFTGGHSSYLSSSDSRSAQIASISGGLATTAAHELGHNIGLEHRDSYGIVGLGPPEKFGELLSGGLQNQNIMATGVTGLLIDRGNPLTTFSDFSHVKLEFAQGLNANPLAIAAEQTNAHNSASTAQAIELVELAFGISGYNRGAVVADASFSDVDGNDYYAIDLKAGEKLSLQTISRISDYHVDDFDTDLRLFDTNGVTLLARNADTLVGSESINDVQETLYTTDSTYFNFLTPADGTYFVRVNLDFSTDRQGTYDLILAAKSVPEPGSLGLLTMTAMGVLGRRRRNYRH